MIFPIKIFKVLFEIVKPKGIIIGLSSDIGLELFKHLETIGYDIIGTFRDDKNLKKIDEKKLFYCNLLDIKSIKTFQKNKTKFFKSWELLIFAVGDMNPLGNFLNCDIDEWCNSIQINFVNQMRILHGLLNERSKSKINKNTYPTVIFFAGGGTNSAPSEISAYTLSKIALIKATEILDNEIKNFNFIIIGPGWIETKIHKQMIDSKNVSNEKKRETMKRLKSKKFNSIEALNQCVSWVIHNSNKLSGRNISLENDNWGSNELLKFLNSDNNNYKLRRYGNDS